MNDRANLNKAGFSDYQAIGQAGGTAPVEISQEFYWEMLEVLPPQKWTRGHDYESFYIQEGLTGNLHEWITRIGKRYFALIAPRSCTHEQIIDKCLPLTQGATV